MAAIAPIQSHMQGTNRTNAVLGVCRLDEDENQMKHEHNIDIVLYVIVALLVGILIGGMI